MPNMQIQSWNNVHPHLYKWYRRKLYNFGRKLDTLDNPKVMCSLEPFYWCMAAGTEDFHTVGIPMNSKTTRPDATSTVGVSWNIKFPSWRWLTFRRLLQYLQFVFECPIHRFHSEELFSDTCEQGQEFKRIYSTFSCCLACIPLHLKSSQPWWNPSACPKSIYWHIGHVEIERNKHKYTINE